MGIQWYTDPVCYLHYLHVRHAWTQLNGVTAVRDLHAAWVTGLFTQIPWLVCAKTRRATVRVNADVFEIVD